MKTSLEKGIPLCFKLYRAIKVLAEENLMKLYLSKTKELVVRGRTTLPPPKPIVAIKPVSYLKLLGATLQGSPTDWDKHFDDLIDLDYLFNSLIMTLFTYHIRVWGVAAYTIYLSQIDRLLRRAFQFGYIQHETSIQQVIKTMDVRLWKSITGTSSHTSPAGSSSPRALRGRSHPYQIPRVKYREV